MDTIRPFITGSGLWKPANTISNDELVHSYNAWVEQNIALFGDKPPFSNSEFIEKASGIKSRYVIEKDGILDTNRMRPSLTERPDDDISIQAEMAIEAAKDALCAANKLPNQIDAVIVSSSYTQRPYPAIAIEVQHALGIDGFAFDMQVACSSGTFGLHRAYEMVKAGTANSVLVISPELTSPQVNFTDRDSHFIFGDVATAMVVENSKAITSPLHTFEMVSVRAATQFSNNIRSNFGYTARACDTDPFSPQALFHQNGRKVFKEVCPMAADHLENHVASNGLKTSDIKRWWLHQANINMNQLIIRRLLGKDADQLAAPIILDQFANIASAGSLVAFNLYHQDMEPNDLGVICSFGAGYSIGSLLLKKI